jgi:hypothetical protein
LVLKSHRLYALLLLILGLSAGTMQVTGVLGPLLATPAAESPAPPGQVAAAAGLVVTYDPHQAGLTLLTEQPRAPAGAAGARGPLWREVVRLEPRALVGATWEPPTVPASQTRPPTLAVRHEPDSVVVHLDGLQVGDAIRSSWSLTLSRATPAFTLDRVDTLLRPREVSATALVVTSGPNALRDRLVLVNGTAYTLAEGGIDRLGNHGLYGVVNRDPALTFTLASPETTRARGERQGERDVLLLSAERPAAAGSPTVHSSIRGHVGARVPLQQAFASFSPATEAFLLAAGYYGNVFVSETNGRVLTASMVVYSDSVWMRDVAMAARGYAYVLDDLATVRNTLAQFLKRTSATGVVPEYFNEAGQSDNRGAWDAMPDLIHSVYAYVSKTRDVGFLNEHLDTLISAREWIRALDTDGDGLPDRDVYPYGYFDSVENGVMHTYAIASFYAAHLELAELAELVGRDGAAYREYAERMRVAFNRPVAAGGYWQEDRGYPIAWKKADGRLVAGFETFGVLAAVRVGLIVDEERLKRIAEYLRDRREEFVNQNAFPLRLMVGGYDRALLRAGVPEEQRWLLDANAPWIVGHDVAVRARFGAFDDAAYVLSRYEDAAMQYPPMAEFGAAPSARHGAGETHDGGRLWDNSAWFDAVYGTHYGLRMTPRALVIQPNPLRRLAEDTVEGVTYQGMRFRLTVRPDGYTLRVLEGAARTVVFHPVGRYGRVSVNGGPQQPTHTLTVRPGETYVIQSFGAPAAFRH